LVSAVEVERWIDPLPQLVDNLTGEGDGDDETITDVRTSAAFDSRAEVILVFYRKQLSTWPDI